MQPILYMKPFIVPHDSVCVTNTHTALGMVSCVCLVEWMQPILYMKPCHILVCGVGGCNHYAIQWVCCVCVVGGCSYCAYHEDEENSAPQSASL